MHRPPPLPAREIRRARALLGTPAPTQRELAELVGLDGPAVARLERGRRRPRGVLHEVLLALIIATRSGADMREVLDARRPRGHRLAALFRAAYPEGAR